MFGYLSFKKSSISGPKIAVYQIRQNSFKLYSSQSLGQPQFFGGFASAAPAFVYKIVKL